MFHKDVAPKESQRVVITGCCATCPIYLVTQTLIHQPYVAPSLDKLPKDCSCLQPVISAMFGPWAHTRDLTNPFRLSAQPTSESVRLPVSSNFLLRNSPPMSPIFRLETADSLSYVLGGYCGITSTILDYVVEVISGSLLTII